LEPQAVLKCPQCGSTRVFHDGFRKAPLNAVSNNPIQRYRCAEYGHRFSDHVVLNTVRDNKGNSQISANHGAKNLTPTQKIKICVEKKRYTPTENEIKATPQIEKLLEQLRNDGRKSSTVINYRKALKTLLNGGADLFDPENTKRTLAKLPLKGTSKKTITAMLTIWFEFNGISWKAPKYTDSPETPYIPTEAEIDQFIACLGKKTAVYCQLLKDTGARCGEIKGIKWTDIDFGQRKIRIKAEKGSNSRILPLSSKTIDMICTLPRDKERLFTGDQHSNFALQRKRKAQQLANPKLMLIHFHTFRHWKATTEQHRTKDPWHVKMILGHKSIQSTENYIHLEQMMYDGESNDQFTVKVADTMDDAIKLMEVGFEFHAEIEGHKLFRKRK
jgi:integrase